MPSSSRQSTRQSRTSADGTRRKSPVANKSRATKPATRGRKSSTGRTSARSPTLRVGSYVLFDPLGYTSNLVQGGKIMERFHLKGPLPELGEGAEEVEDGHRYPGGRVSLQTVREAYCVRFNSDPRLFVARLASQLTPITAAKAREVNKEITGSSTLPSSSAARPPPRCGKPL